jgi:hypothetical protein
LFWTRGIYNKTLAGFIINAWGENPEGFSPGWLGEKPGGFFSGALGCLGEEPGGYMNNLLKSKKLCIIFLSREGFGHV